MSVGHKRWTIAEGYIPAWSHGPEPQMTSHETVCMLNTSSEQARVTKDTDFATLIESSIPIVVQHTRLDSRQAENALISTIAYPAGD
jgi:hypothetical protein